MSFYFIHSLSALMTTYCSSKAAFESKYFWYFKVKSWKCGMSQQMDSLAVSSLLCRVNRLQLPLFPEGYPWGVWGGCLHPASRELPGGGLALQQGRCSEWHAVQQCLGSDAEQFNKRQRSKKVVTWRTRRVREPAQDRLNWTELRLSGMQITIPWSQHLKYRKTARTKGVETALSPLGSDFWSRDEGKFCFR